MRAVVQRVVRAEVRVAGTVRGRCGRGLLILLGIATPDGGEQAERLASRIARLRVFEGDDGRGRFERSLLEIEGEALVVSQFTLLAGTTKQKGARPDFSGAARAEAAEPLYEQFCAALRALGVHVETGVFGAVMEVELVNDGPVTIVSDVD